MAAIVPKLWFVNVIDGTTYVTSAAGEISTWTIDRGGDAPCHVHIEIGLGTNLATYLILATGGPTLAAPPLPLLGYFSLDNGATYDISFMLTSCQRSLDPANPLLLIDQDDLAAVYAVNGVDRVTFVDADPAQVLHGEVNTIVRPGFNAVPPEPPIGTNRTWVYTKGLDKTTVAPAGWVGQPQRQMHMLVNNDPPAYLANKALSVDINSDTITNSLRTIASRLAGEWSGADTAPPGARGHWVSMSGSGSRNVTGIEKALALGWVGTSPRVTFDGDATAATWDETTTAHVPSQGMLIDPQLAEMYYQTCFIGGISDHGIDTGMSTSGGQATEITCCVVINVNRLATSTLWDDSLPIVGTTSGVYYYPHHGFLVPMSQAFVVNALAYNPAGTLYAATPTGVFFAPAQPPPFRQAGNPAFQWYRLGGLSAPVEDVWLDGNTVIVRCGGTTKKNGKGVDGVYCYPALSGDHTGDTQGYAGWSRIAHSGSPLAAGGTVAHLYYTDANKPNLVYHLQPGTTNPPQVVDLRIPAGVNVIGIDTGVLWTGASNDHVYVRTDAGALAAYSIHIPSGSPASLNMAGGIESSDGSVVQIRKITAVGHPIFGSPVALLAATNAGLYWTETTVGAGWSAPNAVSGLGDFDIDFAVAGAEQTILTRRTVRLFAGAKRSFLISNNAGDNWTDLLAAKLDKGPFWAELARQCGLVPWPDNNWGALGDAAGVAQTGGSGDVRAIPTGNPRVLPSGWIWARRLDEQCNFVFRLVNVTTTAPLAGIQYHELSDIQANANVGAIRASEAVALVEWRWLSAVSVPRQALTLQASFTQDNAALRDLTFGDQSRVLYNPSGWTSVAALDLILYVTRHRMTGRAGYVATETTVASTLESGPLNPDAMAAYQADRLTKKLRWGSA